MLTWLFESKVSACLRRHQPATRHTLAPSSRERCVGQGAPSVRLLGGLLCFRLLLVIVIGAGGRRSARLHLAVETVESQQRHRQFSHVCVRIAKVTCALERPATRR
jgi:hypothetical protein